MTRHLVLAGVLATLVAGVFAGSASADGPDTTRHKVCVLTPGTDPIIPGYCVTWIDPVGQPTP